MISVSEIAKSYGSKVALDSVSFDVLPGEVVAILGPNGAGKTTTLRVITGLVKPTHGTVAILGKSAAPETVQKEVGYLPDEPFLYPKLTGREFLTFLASIRRLPQKVAEARISELTTAFDLTDGFDELTEAYSLGMKRKLALCGALLHNPSILVLDEPLNGLDPKSVKRVKELLVEFSAAGKCVLLSTHLLDIAQALCTSVAIINKGKLILEKQPMGQVRGSLEERFLAITAQ